MSRFYCSGLSFSMVCRARVTHVAYELGMEELLVARNAGIDSTCRRFETGKAEEDLNEGSEHPMDPEERIWEVVCNSSGMQLSLHAMRLAVVFVGKS